ncbi:MAG: helix-turn-helix domain-containing protein [Sphaerochaetaceae bacterium]|nr:helix-turn-helix domain-containing protein [Sphaerochaetaceae bacterium]
MENKSGNVQSLERALILIDVLAENSDGVSIKTLAEATSLNKSTIYRLLQTLVNFGYAYQDSQNDKYHLGIKILSLSNSLLENIDFREVARPFLKDLVKETGNIAQ